MLHLPHHRVIAAGLIGWLWCALAVAAHAEPTRGDAKGGRTWVDSTGKHQVEAALLSHNEKSVNLRLADGKSVEVPIARLSRRDQRYLKGLNEGEGPVQRALDAFKQQVESAQAKTRAAVGKSVPSTPKNGLDALKAVPEKIEEKIEELIAPEQPMPADIVYVQVSRELVRKLLARPIARVTAVNDRIVGTPVSGTANLSGQVNLGFVPSHDRAIVDLTFNGQIHSTTVGHGGPVQVHSGGLTTFSAVKRLMFDHNGIQVQPAQVNAQTTTNIQGVSTSLPRLRGRIARRIGTQRAYELKSAAEAESAQKAELRIARDFDSQVWRNLWQGRSQITRFASQLPVKPGALRGQVWFATSQNYLQVAVVRGEGRLAPVAPPDPGQLDRPDVVVHVHSSLVNRVIRDDELQDAIKPLVNLLFANEARRYVSSLQTANPTQIDLKQSRDGAWWTVTVRAPQHITLPLNPVTGW